MHIVLWLVLISHCPRPYHLETGSVPGTGTLHAEGSRLWSLIDLDCNLVKSSCDHVGLVIAGVLRFIPNPFMKKFYL